MGDGSLFDTLWRAKFTIVLALLLIIAATTASMIYLQKRGLESDLSTAQANYSALSGTYNKLVADHNALTADHNSLTNQYNGLNYRYNKLSVNYSYLQSANDNLNSRFNDLNNTVNNFKEGGGAKVAVTYSSYVNTATPPKKILDAIAYNVGSSRANHVFIRCSISDNSSTSQQSQQFDNIDPLHKCSAHWEFNSTVAINSVWVDVAS